MCGITGFQKPAKINITYEELVNATNSIKHRGPDDSGVYYDSQIGLGHRRLSIIDLSKTGHQPMNSANERFVIVFNGEIYNYLEIKQELIDLGITFNGSSDTEVIVNGFQIWGEAIIKKLNGIFSIAIWDSIDQNLFLYRDRMGVKPLYYYYEDEVLLFGSEIKTILNYSFVKRKINIQGFHEFLYYGYALGGNTMFDKIYKLTPGARLKVAKGRLEKELYWKHEDICLKSNLKEKDIFQKTRNLLETAVKRQLISDVPVGVFLSGGIDSSAITAFATRHYEGKIKSYSAGFDFDNNNNELPLAAKVAKHYGTEHQEMMIKGKDLKDIIRLLIKHHDEPFSDAANIPLYLLTKEVKDKCKVILQGDGGDELFAGYPRYHILKHFNFYKFIFSVTKPFSLIIPSKYISQKTERFYPLFFEASQGKMFGKFLTVEHDTIGNPESLLSDLFNKKVNSTIPFKEYQNQAERFSFLNDKVQQMLWIDTCIILPDQFLEKVDKSTMANGIEVRVPFLDNELMEYALSLPSSLKVKKGVKKYVLKKALEGIVPNEVLYGPKKGFGVPYYNWIKGPLKEFMIEIFNSSKIRQINLFDYTELNRRIEEHVSGKKDWGFILWKMMNFCIWVEEYDVEM